MLLNSTSSRRWALIGGLLALALGALLWTLHGRGGAPAGSGPVVIQLTRFFGSCDAKYGQVTQASQASGECGIMTALVNQFNAEHSGQIQVKVQVAEWGPYYDQLAARLVAKDTPTIAVMHESVLSDYVRRQMLEPLDSGFAEVGIPVERFTDHARRGVVFGGQHYALPWDTWSWLWHINTRLMAQAGLMKPDGTPLLPRSPQELLEHARRFRQATGKPYFSWAVTNEASACNRTFQTLLAQQNGRVFSDDGKRIDMHTPEATQALELMHTLYAEGHVRPNLDYGGSHQAFLNGDAGVLVVGTWTIDAFLQESQRAASPLYKAYTVQPFPQLYQRPTAFADGHSWVLFKAGVRDPRTRAAALTLMKFLWEHNYDWSRTGNLPVDQQVVASAAFRALPMRPQLAELTQTGQAMPSNVPTQRAVEIFIGEEVANLLLSDKPIAEVQTTVEKRVNGALKKIRR